MLSWQNNIIIVVWHARIITLVLQILLVFLPHKYCLLTCLKIYIVNRTNIFITKNSLDDLPRFIGDPLSPIASSLERTKAVKNIIVIPRCNCIFNILTPRFTDFYRIRAEI
ncbi:hypothetical protein EDC94DRAFT_590109 [Helicostylum pulchrum]|nr:hypothetical protein EDC94DRAFT_590109 [Helicostylum pulchrum]